MRAKRSAADAVRREGLFFGRAARRARPAALAGALVGAALLAVVAFGAAGCGGGSGDSAPSLEGTSWKLTGWSEGGQDPADFTITAQFADGRIGGTSAVNSYGGPYETGEDGSFSVGELVSTMMAGPEPDMRAEQTYLRLLPQATKYAVTGDTLTLSDDGGTSLLTYTKTAAPSGGG